MAEVDRGCGKGGHGGRGGRGAGRITLGHYGACTGDCCLPVDNAAAVTIGGRCDDNNVEDRDVQGRSGDFVARDMVGVVVLEAGSGDGDRPDLVEEAIGYIGLWGIDEVVGGQGRGCGRGHGRGKGRGIGRGYS